MENWMDVVGYRDFWDQPRIFFVRYKGHLILFDCAFDEATEDYPDDYVVYRMPELTDSEWEGSWAGIADRAIEKLGMVPLTAVQFDATRRKQIDQRILKQFSPQLEPATV
jgi:hypothetical protein